MGFSGKRLLILGGTKISCEVVLAAKKMGITTVVTDYNVPEESPAKLIADESYMVSATDVDAVVSLIKEKNIDGVLVGFNDLLLPYYAQICDKAGLPAYGTKEQFEIFTDKAKYKELMRKFDVPTVEEYEISIDKIDESIEKVKFPVLVKPSDSSGARGITICNNRNELEEAINKAYMFSKNNKILVEQYLLGREVTVFWIFIDGKYYVSAIGNRHVKNNQEGVIPLPAGYTYPASVIDEYRSDIMLKARNMFESVGIKNGMMFMQCKIEKNQCVVYDIGYRLTGSLEYKNIEHECKYNPMEMLISYALSGSMLSNNDLAVIDTDFGGYEFNVSCLAAPGVIDHYEGIDKVRNMDGILDVVIDHEEGEEITPEMKGLLSQICVRILGYASGKDELWNRIDTIQKSIRIISNEGIDLCLPGMVKDDLMYVR